MVELVTRQKRLEWEETFLTRSSGSTVNSRQLSGQKQLTAHVRYGEASLVTGAFPLRKWNECSVVGFMWVLDFGGHAIARAYQLVSVCQTIKVYDVVVWLHTVLCV